MKLPVLLILTYFHVISASLDFKELDDVNYGIEILDTPVLLEETPSQNAVHMTSMFGQHYQCSYQGRSEEQRKEKEEEKLAEETGIVELLKPMKTQPCLIHSKGWWSYEFCYGLEIKQYRLEDNKVSGQVINMGFYESDFNWDEKVASITKKAKQKYHSQQYVNGTTCDLTGKHRRTEIRFVCDQSALTGDFITRIDEPETCVYTMTVNTIRLCNHPVFKPATPNKPITISCNPALNEQDFDLYLDQKEEELVTEKLLLEQDIDSLQESMADYEIIDGDEAPMRRLPKGSTVDGIDPNSAQDPLHPGSVPADTDPSEELALNTLKGLDQQVREAAEAIQSAVQQSLNKGMRELFGDDVDDGNMKMDFKILDDASDIKKAIQDMMKTRSSKKGDTKDEEIKSEEKTTKDFISKVTDSSQRETQSVPESRYLDDDLEEEGEGIFGEDDEHVQEFNKELDNILPNDARKGHMAKYKENIKHSVSADFQNIVDEAKRELNMNTDDQIDDSEESQLVRQLSKTLGTLLKQLDNAEKEYNTADEYVKEGEKQELAELGEDNQLVFDEVEDTETKDKYKEDNQADLKENVKFSKFKIQSQNQNAGGVLSKSAPSTAKISQGSNGVKVKVRTISESELREQDEKENKELAGLMTDDKKKKIEGSVKDQLQKSGLDTGGRNVEVRIITAGYYDDEDGQLHLLPEDESNAFSKMFIAILGQNDEEVKENQRQRKKKKVPTATLR